MKYTVDDREYIIATTGRVGGFMTQLYKAVDYDFGNFSNGAMSACATDEAEFSRPGNTIEDFYNGGWSPANAKGSTWNSMYTVIQAANHFLENFQELTFPDQVLDPKYTALMHQYQNYPYEGSFPPCILLLYPQPSGYGEFVPLIDHYMDAAGANSLSRSTSDEIFGISSKSATKSGIKLS